MIPANTEWTSLKYLNFYRLVLAGFLVALTIAGILPGGDPNNFPRVFLYAALAYVFVAVFSVWTIKWRRPVFEAQVFGQVLADITAISVLMHAAGGVRSGFGILLLVAVAGGSILTTGRMAVLLAAVATIVVLGEQIWLTVYVGRHAAFYQNAGLLGAGLFVTAGLTYFAARRLRASEALVAKREIDLANLAKLNEHIIQRMQSGIVATDATGGIRLLNESARRYLGVNLANHGVTLEQVLPALATLVTVWRADPRISTFSMDGGGNGIELTVSFAGIGGQDGIDGVLIFLEDAASVRQRAQQLNLASLGRLTASIAHEIRNPLGAISHAGQLLAETPELSDGDKRLTRIIRDNSERVNSIIENVLGLSRRRVPIAEEFDVAPWLVKLVDELCQEENCSAQELLLDLPGNGVFVRFDKSQLRQIVSNLVDNGLRHAGQPREVRIRCAQNELTQRPYLEVQDNGGGVSENERAHLFEPFFTNSPSGTGLGLYISREIAQANQATLKLMANTEGACFRLSFAHPKSQGGIAA